MDTFGLIPTAEWGFIPLSAKPAPEGLSDHALGGVHVVADEQVIARGTEPSFDGRWDLDLYFLNQ